MTELKIRIANVNSSQATHILSDINNCVNNLNKACAIPIDFTFQFESNDQIDIPTAPESTPFTRYISSTTPEGRT